MAIEFISSYNVAFKIERIIDNYILSLSHWHLSHSNFNVWQWHNYDTVTVCDDEELLKFYWIKK